MNNSSNNNYIISISNNSNSNNSIIIQFSSLIESSKKINPPKIYFLFRLQLTKTVYWRAGPKAPEAKPPIPYHRYILHTIRMFICCTYTVYSFYTINFLNL